MSYGDEQAEARRLNRILQGEPAVSQKPQPDRPDLEELRDLVREAVLLSAAHLDIFQREDSHRKLRSILANVSDYHLLALLSERDKKQQDLEEAAEFMAGQGHRIAELRKALRELDMDEMSDLSSDHLLSRRLAFIRIARSILQEGAP